MKIYVINLDRSKDRLDHITKIFAEQRLDFIRIPAVDGRTLSEEVINSWLPRSICLRQPSPAEIGCFLSHRECLRLIAEGDDDFAAIFEDDVIISNDARFFLRDAAWIPPGTDIVKIETADIKCLIGPEKKIVFDGYQLAPLLSKHYCTGGYIISKSCAERLLTNLNHSPGAIDEMLFNPDYGLFQKLVVHQLVPAIVRQGNFKSLIQPPRYINGMRKRSNLPIHKKVLREANRFKKHSLRPFIMTIFKGCRWGKIPFK